MSTQVAFVGLGPIGQGISRRLAESGKLYKPLLLWNRTSSVAEDYAQELQNAIAVQSLAEVTAKSDIIWSCLANDEAVQETYASIAAERLSGKIIVESSTVSAATIDEIEVKIRTAGGALVAMPVFGDPKTVASGKMIAVPAGPVVALEKLEPLLIGVTAAAIVDFPDERPSKASILKLIGNVLILTTFEQVAELLVFGEKAGLGTKAVEKLLMAMYSGGPQQHSNYASLMTSGEYHQRKANVGTSTAIALAEKILDLAGSLGAQLRGYEVAVQHLREARDTSGPSSDVSGIYGAVRKGSGLEFKN